MILIAMEKWTKSRRKSVGETGATEKLNFQENRFEILERNFSECRPFLLQVFTASPTTSKMDREQSITLNICCASIALKWCVYFYLINIFDKELLYSYIFDMFDQNCAYIWCRTWKNKKN